MSEKAFNVFQFRSRQGTTEEEVTRGIVDFKRQKAPAAKPALASLYKEADRREAEAKLDFVAVCLVGHAVPTPKMGSGNGETERPVYVMTGRSPADAAKQAQRMNSQKLSPRVTLAYVWTRSDAHAKRLKAALDDCILGSDPEMVELNGMWRDLPEWEEKWPEFLKQAVLDIEDGGETIETFDEEGKARLIEQMVDKKYGRSR